MQLTSHGYILLVFTSRAQELQKSFPRLRNLESWELLENGSKVARIVTVGLKEKKKKKHMRVVFLVF